AILSLKSALKIANNKIEALERVINVRDEEIKSMKRQKSVEDLKILQRSVESVNALKPSVNRVNKQARNYNPRVLGDKKLSLKNPTTEQLFRRKKVPIIDPGDQTQKSKNAIAIRNPLNRQKSLDKNSDVEKKISEPNVTITSSKSTIATGDSVDNGIFSQPNALGLRGSDSKEKPKQHIVSYNQRSKPNSSANGSKSTKKSD
uniref:Uncharacterized protein n=1 Tax=Romanomermis culicivorax TaxID=13658 RepID=A0A915HK68_ROMCU